MRRALAGSRAARTRPSRAARAAATAGLVALALAGCSSEPVALVVAAPSAGATTVLPAVPATTTPAPTRAPASTPPPAPASTPPPVRPETVAVPAVVGKSSATAQSALRGRGLTPRVVARATATHAPGTVIAQSHRADAALRPGTVVTLQVAIAPPKPKPTPKPTPSKAAQPDNCHSSYPDLCVKTGVGDYDCEGGTGNGPNYVRGPFRVSQPDPFRLDADKNGIGCER